jgi:hypothetical protein
MHITPQEASAALAGVLHDLGHVEKDLAAYVGIMGRYERKLSAVRRQVRALLGEHAALLAQAHSQAQAQAQAHARARSHMHTPVAGEGGEEEEEEEEEEE